MSAQGPYAMPVPRRYNHPVAPATLLGTAALHPFCTPCVTAGGELHRPAVLALYAQRHAAAHAAPPTPGPRSLQAAAPQDLRARPLPAD